MLTYSLTKEALALVRLCHKDGKLSQCFEYLRFIGDGKGTDIFSVIPKYAIAQYLHDSTGISYIFIYNALPRRMSRPEFCNWKNEFEQRLLKASVLGVQRQDEVLVGP